MQENEENHQNANLLKQEQNKILHEQAKLLT